MLSQRCMGCMYSRVRCLMAIGGVGDAWETAFGCFRCLEMMK